MNLVSPWLFAQSSGGNATPSPPELLLEWLTHNSSISWGIAIFVVVTMTTAAIAKLIGNLDTILIFADKYRLRQTTITDEQSQKLRQQLIEVLLRQAVKRLEDSSHHKIRLNLRRTEERRRVGQRDLSSSLSSAQVTDYGEVIQRRYRVIKPFAFVVLLPTCLNSFRLPVAQLVAVGSDPSG